MLVSPFVATVTLPVVAPLGTIAEMLVELHALVAALTPLNITVPLVPRFVPEIVTAVPAFPEPGLMLLITGAGCGTTK